MPLGPAISTHEQVAIIQSYTAGMPAVKIAKKLNRHPGSIWRVIRAYKQTPIPPSIVNYKTELKEQSVDMLKTALTRTKSQDLALKAAPTAIAVLKGLGEFSDGQNATGIMISISLPSSLSVPQDIVVSPPDNKCDDNNPIVINNP